MSLFYLYTAVLVFVASNIFAEAQVLQRGSDPKCPHELYHAEGGDADVYIELYRTCFDPINVVTKYTQHTIYGTFSDATGECNSRNFRSNLYTTNQMNAMQMANIRKLTTTDFPTYHRGHLTPCADFPPGNQRRATMEIINSLPQLGSLNIGDWKRMENFLRSKATMRGVNVVSGGLGVLQFNGQPIYLDRNKYPIPEFMYKVARERKEGKDVLYAFIAFNSKEPVDQQRLDELCNTTSCDVAGVSQLKCCEPTDFIANHLPDFLEYFGVKK